VKKIIFKFLQINLQMREVLLDISGNYIMKKIYVLRV